MEAWAGVVGVIAGGILGWLARWWQTKREWERDDARLWTHERRLLYTEMANAVDDMLLVLGTEASIRRGVGIPEGLRAPNDEEIDVMSSRALTRLSKARDEISLISSDPVVSGADQIWAVAAKCRVGRSQYGDMELYNALESAKAEFREAVRRDIGVL